MNWVVWLCLCILKVSIKAYSLSHLVCVLKEASFMWSKNRFVQVTDSDLILLLAIKWFISLILLISGAERMQMRRCRCLQKSCLVCMEHLSLCQNSPRSPFHRAQQKWPAHRALSEEIAETNTSYYTPPLEIYICLILKVSEFGPLLLSIFQRKSDSQQALRQEPLSTCFLTHISLGLFHNLLRVPVCHL